MSPSPEKNSIPDKPSQAPTAGENPNTAGHLAKLPYDNEPLNMHHDEDVTVDTGQIQQVIDSPNQLPDGRTPAQELPAAKRNKLRLIWAGIGVAATSALVTAGVLLGNNVAAGDKDDTTPKPETTATAPAQPTPPVETKPVQTAPGEAQPKPVDEWKFYNTDGTFRTAEQIKREAAVSPELRSNVAALDVIFENIEETVNYFPNRKTVLEALNIPESELTPDHFVTVARQYQDLKFDVMVRGNGELRKWLDRVGLNALGYRIASIQNEDKVEYHMDISQDFITTQTVTVTDNAALSGATQRDPAPDLGTYRVISRSGNDITVIPRPAEADPDTYISTYSLDSNIGLIKKDTK